MEYKAKLEAVSNQEQLVEVAEEFHDEIIDEINSTNSEVISIERLLEEDEDDEQELDFLRDDLDDYENYLSQSHDIEISIEKYLRNVLESNISLEEKKSKLLAIIKDYNGEFYDVT